MCDSVFDILNGVFCFCDVVFRGWVGAFGILNDVFGMLDGVKFNGILDGVFGIWAGALSIVTTMMIIMVSFWLQ